MSLGIWSSNPTSFQFLYCLISLPIQYNTVILHGWPLLNCRKNSCAIPKSNQLILLNQQHQLLQSLNPSSTSTSVLPLNYAIFCSSRSTDSHTESFHSFSNIHQCLITKIIFTLTCRRQIRVL